MSSGYYPAGAEHDPRAPYNQPVEREVEVVATCRLSRVDQLFVEDETGHFEDGATPQELQLHYECQHGTPQHTLNDCARVLSKLIENGERIYARTDLLQLLDEVVGWSMEEFEVQLT